MAKDKGKKKSSAPEGFAKPSEAKGGGDSWSLTDGDDPKSGQNDGRLFILTPLREESVDVTRGKKTESVKVIVADVVMIDEKKPGKSEAHDEVYVWGKWVQGAIRSSIGIERVLGRLEKEDDSASAVGYVWKLTDATKKEEALAMEYFASLDPFKQKGADDKKAAGKKSGKAEPAKAEKAGKKGKAKAEPEPKKKSKKK